MHSVKPGKYLIRCLILILLSVWFSDGFSQVYNIKLYISDDARLPVPNAGVTFQQKKLMTDSVGFIELQMPAGKQAITFSSVNHHPATIIVQISGDTSLSIGLRLRESLLNAVTVTASRNVHRNQMSTQSISIAQIKKLPVILGEIDPLKTITLLPGIKNGGEASAGIYVRGGGPDQNLVLLDGNPVYNPNHLLGFFSIFNGEAIRGIDVIKGGMPAEYGGRLSSVIAVDTRSGSKDSLHASGGIGLISSRLSAEGPIVKGKSSFIVSGRRTYIDQVAKLVASDTIGNNG